MSCVSAPGDRSAGCLQRLLFSTPAGVERQFQRVRGQALPPWAADIGAHTWAQFFLKWILAHPAVTCAIPATRNPTHMADNMGAASGPLPDEATRRKMAMCSSTALPVTGNFMRM